MKEWTFTVVKTVDVAAATVVYEGSLLYEGVRHGLIRRETVQQAEASLGGEAESAEYVLTDMVASALPVLRRDRSTSVEGLSFIDAALKVLKNGEALHPRDLSDLQEGLLGRPSPMSPDQYKLLREGKVSRDAPLLVLVARSEA